MKQLQILGTAVFGIKKLAGKFAYDSETDGFKGKNYFRYRAQGRVFIVHEDDEFNQQYDNKVLAEVHLIETPSEKDPSVMQLTFDYAVTQDQIVNHTSFEAKIEAIKAGPVTAKIASLDEVEDL
jgi:hypothetical protein